MYAIFQGIQNKKKDNYICKNNNEYNVPYRREAKIGRNQLCFCKSGKKYKHCCIKYKHKGLLKDLKNKRG